MELNFIAWLVMKKQVTQSILDCLRQQSGTKQQGKAIKGSLKYCEFISKGFFSSLLFCMTEIDTHHQRLCTSTERKSSSATKSFIFKEKKSPYCSFREAVIAGGLREHEDSRSSWGWEAPCYLVHNNIKEKGILHTKKRGRQKSRERERKYSRAFPFQTILQTEPLIRKSGEHRRW